MAKKASKKKAGKKAAKKAAKKITKKSAKKAGKKVAKKTTKKKARRTVMYSSAGKKLYAKRSADGQFTDIQTYARAHAADIRQNASAEQASAPAAPSGDPGAAPTGS